MAPDPDHAKLLEACNVVARKMRRDGTWGDVHRTREYVDSLLESSMRRFPDLIRPGPKLEGMRESMVGVLTQAQANERGN